jgi:transcriptional regulator with XRE-family HTH domain
MAKNLAISARPLWAIRLQKAREEAGYRFATDFARLMGLSQQRYAQYEAGVREPNIELLAALCAALNTSADYIIFGRNFTNAA